MDLNQAIKFGQLVNAAYGVQPTDLANKAGQNFSASLGANNTAYQVITSVYANDLATDANPQRGNDQVSIGLILQAPATGDAVVAIRGTQGIDEWLQDARFDAVKCPFLPGAGKTEDGFTSMYNSLATSVAPGSPSVTTALATLPWVRNVNSLTICGHSLGGALATLLALDVAANSNFRNPIVYTYASPCTGDDSFVDTYNQVVPNTTRIANRADVVPLLPPLYDQVHGLFELIPFKLALPPFLVRPGPLCAHILTSYLHLLSLAAKGTVLPLDKECIPL